MRLGFLLVLLLPSIAQAQLNIRAITTREGSIKLRVGNQSVDTDEIHCGIQRYQGDWAWVRFNSGRSGWVMRSEVVPLNEAVSYFTNKIRAEPSKGVWYQLRGSAWDERGEADLALADISEAIRRAPGAAAYWNSRGETYRKKKAYDRALADYNQSLRLKPNASAWNNAGLARGAKGQYQKALDNYAQAIRLEPRYPSYFNNRAWLWATARDSQFRDGQKAIDSARRACELSDWQEWSFIDTLAAAYAEAGDFEKAVNYQKRAIGLLPADEPRRQQAIEQLRLFESGKPVRE